MRPLIDELFVLGELMVQPMSGSSLHETARRILGPFRPLSWGIHLSPAAPVGAAGTGDVGHRTAAARLASCGAWSASTQLCDYPCISGCFLSLLLAPGAYSRDTPEEFVIKLTKFQFLTPAQRVTVLQWYRSYQDLGAAPITRLRDYMRHNSEITQGERA